MLLVSTMRSYILAGIAAPVVELTSPANGSFFDYGDAIDWQVSVEDGNLPGGVNCNDIAVELALSHVTGATEHAHGLIAATGCSGSFDTGTISGHDGDEIFLGVIASYTNSDGITAKEELELQPRLREAEHWTMQSGVQAEPATDIGGGFSAAYINSGDWVMFRDMNLVNVNEIDVRVSSATPGGTIQARIGGVNGQVVGTLEVNNTGGWQVWETRTMAIAPAAQNLGANDLYFTFSGTSNYLLNVNWFDFLSAGPTTNPDPVEATQRIQAESFAAQIGIQTETTTDVGGGENVAYINAGDSSDYALTVPTTGTYNIAFRVASAQNGGTITLTQGGVALASVAVPRTVPGRNG